MITRRSIGAATFGTLAALARPGAAQISSDSRLFALVVGIDDYQFVPKLAGCVNDAKAIAESVRPFAARVVTLLDAEASREAFLSAWDALTRETRPGDRLLLSLSAHGRREPARVPASKPDGMDETAVFCGFTEHAPGNGQRVFGGEIGARLEASGRRGIVTWFVADTCFSEGLTREVDPRAGALTYRALPNYEIQNDILAGLAVPTTEPGDQPNLIFIASGQRNEPVPEFLIAGKMHGALSYSFAAALRRAKEGAGEETAYGFVRGVVTATRQQAEGRHHPAAHITVAGSAPALGTRVLAATPPSLPPPPRLSVFLLPGRESAGLDLAGLLSGLEQLRAATHRQGADLILDSGKGQLISAAGDLLATGLETTPAVRAALEKSAGVALLKQLRPGGLEMGLVQPGGQLAPGASNSLDLKHPPGERLDLVVRSPLQGKLIVVSLDALGQVRLLRPLHGKNPKLQQAEWRLRVAVQPPSGAGHVVAVFAPNSLTSVLERLSRLEGPANALKLARAVAETAPETEESVSVFGFFS